MFDETIDVDAYNIENVDVYGIMESCIASGLPMQSNFNSEDFRLKLWNEDTPENRDVMRMDRLANTPIGSGHDNALSGIIVQFNVTASQVWWLQESRYHFIQIISSMSKMHKLSDMLKFGTVKFIGVDQRMIDLLMVFVEEGMSNRQLVYNVPTGTCLTARVSTNYRQLKTIYAQRENHLLPEWRIFCDWLETLPHSNWITQQ